MALIPQLFLNAVVALGVIGDNKITAWMATGFLYGRQTGKDADGNELYTVFLVTNRHVVQDRDTLIVRFDPHDGKAARDVPVATRDAENVPLWCTHADPDIDISVTMLNIPYFRDRGITLTFFEEDKHVFFSDDVRGGLLNEGDPVFVLGYPMGLVAPDRQYVVSRSGSISRIKDWRDGYSKDFLVDATVFPGNSGGPVINGCYASSIRGTKTPDKACLIGVVKGYIPFHDRAVSVQTGLTRVTFEENSGLSGVVPADYVKETVDLYYSRTTEIS